MGRTIGKLFLLLASLVLIAVAVMFLFPEKPLPPPRPLPSPNGFDAFVQAGRLLPGSSADPRKMTQDELLVFVEANSNAVQLVRTGLKQECQVPMEFSEAFLSGQMTDLARIKQLALALVAEGKLADMENRPQDAALAYLDIVHFGNESARGGLLIHALIGIAIKSIGLRELQTLPGRLDARSCREAAIALEVFDGQSEPWPEMMERERDWSRRSASGLKQRLAALMMSSSLKKSTEQSERRFKDQVSTLRRLTVAFAARAYELDKGRKPKNVADLAPDYLKAVPQDPVTGKDVAYP